MTGIAAAGPSGRHVSLTLRAAGDKDADVSETAESGSVQPERTRSRALIVDDERNIRATLAVCLEDIGCEVTAVESGAAALEALQRSPFDLAFLDLRLGDTDGLELLPELLGLRPGLAVIIITAHAAFDTAVEAIRRGAIDYLPKPFTPAQIRHIVERVIERRTMAGRVVELEDWLAREVPEVDLATESAAMRTVLDILTRAATSDAPILLRGENGTGKGVLARAIHAQSPRRSRPFVTVNCPTLSEDLLASELFGHARGAFTGAVRDQAGRVDAAQGGTLFLDEIGEVSPALQSKLLRFVQEKQYERVGETRTRSADLRIIAATNRDLEADVAAGRFREDLYFRLDVISVRVPPLRERPEDIERLARGFLDFFSQRAGRPAPELSRDALEALVAHPWPGNVRELRNTIERATILWPAAVLGIAALPDTISAPTHDAVTLGGEHTLEAIEREHVLRILERAPSLDDAARVLGIDTSTLWRKRKKYEP
jgi:NtrC-family two-component system response regulator AlgB